MAVASIQSIETSDVNFLHNVSKRRTTTGSSCRDAACLCRTRVPTRNRFFPAIALRWTSAFRQARGHKFQGTPRRVHERGKTPINTNLRGDKQGAFGSDLELNACVNSHGLYDPLHFVLRLSPEVHRKIADLQAADAAGKVDFEGLRAYSTYLHEIHWWQHVGSTIGLMLSLSYPAQAHANYGYLKRFVQRAGPKKSIRQFVESFDGHVGDPETTAGLASVIVNNHFDIEFFRQLIFNPNLVRDAGKHPYFDSVGHSCRSRTAT